MKVSYLKKIRHFIEAFVVWTAYILIHYVLPNRYSITFGAWIARKVGPRLTNSNKARTNLKASFPNLNDDEIEQIVVGMWDNFGRLAVEYINSNEYWDGKTLKNIEIVGLEHLKQFQEDGKAGIMFSAHLGNWKMILLAARSVGFDLAHMYRKPNNPYVDSVFRRCHKFVLENLITKKGRGPRDLLSIIKSGGHAFLLIDQKMGEGISVPFLGRNAMTASGVANMYLNQDCALLPARSERLDNDKFRVTFYPIIDFKPSGDHPKDKYNLLLHINTIMGEWVKERPSQWLWIHRRWD